ncbi:tetratricopeptide repeat protein [bacterium SCSIO 12741]|nr:tetratricopeptide repeat protein [bacterium SCSIO 12741]
MKEAYQIVVFIAFLAGFSTLATAQEEPQFVVSEGQEHIQLNLEGLNEYNAGHYEKAIEFFKKSVGYDSTYTKAYFNMGLSYFKLRRFNESIQSFERVLELDSTVNEAHYYIPFCYYYWGDMEKAKGAYREAIQVFPKKAELYYHLTRILEQEGHEHEELQVYNALLENLPNEELALYNRSVLLNKAQEFELAIRDLDKLIQVNSTNSKAWVERGVMKINLNRIEEGCVDLLRAQELGNTSPAVLELIPKHCHNPDQE